MIINKKYISILSLAIAILLCACSSDNPEVQTVSAEAQPVGGDIQVLAYAPPFANTDPTDAPAGFYAYTPDKTTNMGIYMLSGGAAIKEERITYNNNKWHAYFDVAANTTYTVYGYMPKMGNMSSSLTDVTENAAKLTITGIKPVTTEDICIITGVKDSKEGLKEGYFNWSWPIGDENYSIHLLMDHLYAAVQFHMVIDEDYALLRTIKLKTMTLSTDKGSVNATITLTHNDTGASPVSSVEYSASGSSDAVVVFNSDEGEALDTTTPLVINACFAPTLSENLTMVTTYDVYDRKGNLIRKNCTATNKLPNLDAVRAQQVQLNLTVNPTYLNVLSDPDLDNPTVK
jgi:hypothetical protein